ncbi:MAG: glycosyltransferase family 39 protein [Gammaproteobacteria bacterium]|nr:glycosyltransferase family 39 protein [Gammaproteobacteria bacterium]
MKISNRLRLFLFGLIGILYFLVINPHPDFTKFNAHDSGSYLALSYNMVHGQGYTRNISEESYIPHTLWPPGMAILVMPAILAGGDLINWLAVKTTMIIIGLLGIALAWFYLRRICGLLVADLAAFFIAINPYYWHFSHIVLAEVPLLTWIFGSLLLIDYYWSNRQISMQESFLTGLFIGLGMLIKGSVLGLGLAPLGYILIRNKSNFTIKTFVVRYIIFALAFSIPFLLWSARNQGIDTTGLGLDGVSQVKMILKEIPEDPDSRYRSLAEIIKTIKQNILWYGIYHLPNQIIPGLMEIGKEGYQYKNFFYSFLTLLILVLMIPFKLRLTPILLTIIPMFLLILPLSIGGSARYWFPISILASILVIDKIITMLRKLNIDSNQKKIFASLLSFTLLSIFLGNIYLYITSFSRNPYGAQEPLTELAELFENFSGYCGKEKKMTVYTRNPYVFRLITGCYAPMSNEKLGIQPKYTHAIINSKNLEKAHENVEIISEVSPWVLVNLNGEYTELEIKFRYALIE